jgi:thymidylate synthase (FAD)
MEAFSHRYNVLDHGYVRLVEAWGTGDAGIDNPLCDADFECGIIEAARQSTQGSFRGWMYDEKLLRYLYTHRHATPFEFAGLVVEVQIPIFGVREWQRHRTQSYNEMSARYEALPDLYYLPTPEEVLRRSMLAHTSSNRQSGSIGSKIITLQQAKDWVESKRAMYDAFERQYQQALLDGVPKELARIGMPVAHYTRMRAHANLRNWLAFMTLRADPAAQWEIQQYAFALGKILQAHFPRTYGLFSMEHGS